MEHKFDVDVATKYGLEFALIFKNIQQWCNEDHFTVWDVQFQCPYLKPEKIAPELKKLVDVGILTKLTKKNYAITDKARNLLKKKKSS